LMTGLGDVLRDRVRQLCGLPYVRIHIDIDTTIKPLLVTNKAAASDTTPKTPKGTSRKQGESAHETKLRVTKNASLSSEGLTDEMIARFPRMREKRCPCLSR
jgi:hypothetical protein